MRQHEVLQLVHRDVTVGVGLDLLSELLLEGRLTLPELDLQLAVHLDEALLNVLNNILRHLLLVEHDIVVIEQVGSFLVSGELGWRAKGPLRRMAQGRGQRVAGLQILQAHLELVLLREEQVGVLLDGQLDVRRLLLVHLGTRDEHLSLVKANTDANLLRLLKQVVRIDEALGASVILVEDGVDVVAGRVLSAKRASSIADSRQVNLVFEIGGIALLDLLGREETLSNVSVVDRATSTLGLRLARRVVVSLSSE